MRGGGEAQFIRNDASYSKVLLTCETETLTFITYMKFNFYKFPTSPSPTKKDLISRIPKFVETSTLPTGTKIFHETDYFTHSQPLKKIIKAKSVYQL